MTGKWILAAFFSLIAAHLHSASPALEQLIQAAGEEAARQSVPAVKGAPVASRDGKLSDERRQAVIQERHELFMLAAFSYLTTRMEADPRAGGPIAAILAWDVEDISKTPAFVMERNRNQERQSGLSHAEMLALEKAYAAKPMGASWKGWLDKATLYTTLEPCPMCSAAMIVQHVPKVHYGMQDPSLRDKKDPDRKRKVPLLEEYHGRRLEACSSSLGLCSDLNQKLWEKVDQAQPGEEFRFIDYLRSEHKSLFGPAAKSLRDYAAKHKQNERLLESLKEQALPAR